jgi:raffinose/stachyose/melibiose transport system substrate-binding protein
MRGRLSPKRKAAGTLNKSIRGILGFIAIGTLVVGCSSAASTPTPAPTPTPVPGTTPVPATPTPVATPAKENVTITVMASQDWIKSSEQVLAGRFEEQTGIHIDFQIIPSAQYFDVLKTKLNSGQGIDLFLGQAGKSDMQLQYDAAKNAVDLTNEAWVKSLDPVVADQSSLDGKLYGAEVWDVVGSNYWVMTYNKTIFTKYNLSVPKTFADFETVCDTLLKAGVTPVYEPISDGWHQVLWFPSVGGQTEALEPGLNNKLNANTATFAGDANMATALTQLNDLYKKGFFGKNALSAKEADTSKMMAGGTYAMTLSQLSRGTQIAAAYPNLKATDFGYFPIPLLDNQLQPTHPAGPTWMIYSKSQHVAEAKKWLDFMTQPANLQWLIDNTPDFATLPFTGVKAKWDTSQADYFGTYKQATTLVLQDAVNYVNPQWMDMGKWMVNMFTGQKTAADMLKNIDTGRATLAKAAKDPAWSK